MWQYAWPHGRGSYGLPKVSLGPAMPYPSTPCRRPPLKWPYSVFMGGRPQGRQHAAVFLPLRHPALYASGTIRFFFPSPFILTPAAGAPSEFPTASSGAKAYHRRAACQALTLLHHRSISTPWSGIERPFGWGRFKGGLEARNRGMGERRGVSKRVKDGRKQPALWAGHP
jgi:hypothetical protein